MRSSENFKPCFTRTTSQTVLRHVHTFIFADSKKSRKIQNSQTKSFCWSWDPKNGPQAALVRLKQPLCALQSRCNITRVRSPWPRTCFQHQKGKTEERKKNRLKPKQKAHWYLLASVYSDWARSALHRLCTV